VTLKGQGRDVVI